MNLETMDQDKSGGSMLNLISKKCNFRIRYRPDQNIAKETLLQTNKTIFSIMGKLPFIENIIIQSAGIKDLEQLVMISKQTFAEAFGAENSMENMTKYLNENLSSDKLSAELNNSESEFYFALFDGEVIGYLKLNFGQAQTDIQHEHAIEIERIYVLQSFQDKKVGQKLLEKAIQRAQQNNAGYIWLGVWENNVGAIRFYRKNGFEEFDNHTFKLGDDIQTDIMMKLELTG